MQVININGKKWIVELEWEILPGDSAINKEVKEIAEKTNSRFGILIEYGSTYAIGLSKKRSKIPSAALYLALANQAARENEYDTNYPDWIVLEEVKDDKYWMAVIKSGIPAPQFDAILSITEVKNRITELLINDTYTVFTTSPEIISIFDGIKNIEKRSINDLTEDIKVKIKWLKLAGIPDAIIYSGIAIMIAGIIGYGALSFLEGKNIREKARLLAEKQERERIEKQQRYEAELRAYNDEMKKAREDEINKVVLGLSGDINKILNAFYDNIGNSPIDTHGWELKTIECYFNITSAPKIACDYLYERTNLTTTRMLLEDFPDAKINGDKAVVTKIVEIDPAYISKADSNILETLKSAKDWSFDVQSQLQLLKIVDIDHEIKESSEITYTVRGKPLSPEEIDSGKQPNPPEVNKLGIAMGEIIIKGNTFDWIKELADNVNFYGVGLRKVVFDVKGLGDLSWEARFNYYIKTDDGGSIGSSSTEALDKNKAQQIKIQTQTETISINN